MNWRALVIALLLLASGFYGGYTAAVLGLFGGKVNQAPSQQVDQKLAAQNTSKAPHAWLDIEQGLRKKTSDPSETSVYLAPTDLVELPEEENQGEDYRWQDPSDIISMFDELMSLSEPADDDEVAAFSRAIDQLRTALADSPTQLAILVEHMQTLSFDSKEFHYITAILQGLPDQKGYASLENAALRLSQQEDLQSRQQFLHLVSSTYTATENPEILSALVNIALYSQADEEAKLEALDLVMPFQITSVEKSQILSTLYGMLENPDTENRSTLANHTLRFSSNDEREVIANRFIKPENDLELRYSILDGLHAGTVPRSAQIKEQLFTIARDSSDPLSDQAKHALMYVFDITNQEYQQLKQ
ncbi:hypothetical protein [Glaciecola sp. SC05]|uniref:hypothetical protein n=1 Tax=Glaciecola sp. SC05 TaxID=1987355 RepID=UPI003528058D